MPDVPTFAAVPDRWVAGSYPPARSASAQVSHRWKWAPSSSLIFAMTTVS
jgi:hypothetical protein